MRGRSREDNPKPSSDWQYPFGYTDLKEPKDASATRRRSFLPFGRKKGGPVCLTDDDDSLSQSLGFRQYFQKSAYFDESRDESDYESVAPNITCRRSVRFNSDSPSEGDYDSPPIRHFSEDSLVAKAYCLPSSRLGKEQMIHIKGQESTPTTTTRTRRWIPRCGRTEEELAQLKEEDDILNSFFGVDIDSIREDEDDEKKKIPLNCFRRRKVGDGDNSITAGGEDHSMMGSLGSGFAAYLAETDHQGRAIESTQWPSGHSFSRQTSRAQSTEQQRNNDNGFLDYACPADAFGCMYDGVDESFESYEDHPRRYWFRVAESTDTDSQEDSLAAMSHITRGRSNNAPKPTTKTSQRRRSRQADYDDDDYSAYTDTESGMFSLYSLQGR